MSQPLVSVVTPVYNGEEYLRECIDSVLAQSYTNWRYVLVDNCSKDRTAEIVREYAARDPRIRLHSNSTFVRAMENFNNAVRQTSAESKYCKVLGADDWLMPDCLARMVALAEAHPNVGIVGAYHLEGTEIECRGLPPTGSVFAGRDVARMQLLGGPYVFGTPTTVLYRADLVRTRPTFYNESNLHADDEVCVELLKESDFGFVHQILTARRVDEGSLSSFSQRINTYLAGLLHLVVKQGPSFLSPAEQRQRLHEALDEYYACLATDLLKKGPRAEFWRYHRQKLRELGYPLSLVRVGAAALAVVLDNLLNPKRSVERLVRGRPTGKRPPQRRRSSPGNVIVATLPQTLSE